MNGHPDVPPTPGAPLSSSPAATTTTTATTTTSAERARVALAWFVVLVPAAWGVAQVVAKSAALFR